MFGVGSPSQTKYVVKATLKICARRKRNRVWPESADVLREIDHLHVYLDDVAWNGEEEIEPRLGPIVQQWNTAKAGAQHQTGSQSG